MVFILSHFTSKALIILSASTSVYVTYKFSNPSLRLPCVEPLHVCFLSLTTFNNSLLLLQWFKTRQFSPYSDTIFNYPHIIHIVQSHMELKAIYLKWNTIFIQSLPNTLYYSIFNYQKSTIVLYKTCWNINIDFNP